MFGLALTATPEHSDVEANAKLVREEAKIMDKKYNVEIVEIATGEVVSVIGKDLTEAQAEKREYTGLTRIDRENYFVRTVEAK